VELLDHLSAHRVGAADGHARLICLRAQAVARWHNRVIGYALTLVTDEYPPFRFAP
jgi:hypothetical protein